MGIDMSRRTWLDRSQRVGISRSDRGLKGWEKPLSRGTFAPIHLGKLEAGEEGLFPL